MKATTKKVRIDDHITYNGQDVIRVFKKDYGIDQYISGYYGICKNASTSEACIFGGDSAWADCYDIDIMKSVYENWDGTLVHCGKYGYKIEL